MTSAWAIMVIIAPDSSPAISGNNISCTLPQQANQGEDQIKSCPTNFRGIELILCSVMYAQTSDNVEVN